MKEKLFTPNDPFLYVLALGVILFIGAMAVFFLVRAYRRGLALGMESAILKKTVISSATFTVMPAISILLGVITLAKFLGIPLPWIRMSVIGALTYELPAATSTANVLGLSLSSTVSEATDFTAIVWVMTLGILPSIVLTPLLMKKIQSGLVKIKNKDDRWGNIFMDALFLGMISAFLGVVFAGVGRGIQGITPILVLLVSGAIMALIGLLIKKLHWHRLETYALALSMIGAMAFACVWVHGIG